jgi:hypothetical protein
MVLFTRATDITVTIKSVCPYCSALNTESVDAVYEELDVMCNSCKEFYTVIM